MPSSFELGQDVFAPGKEESAPKPVTPDKEYDTSMSDPDKLRSMDKWDLLALKTKRDQYLHEQNVKRIDKSKNAFESAIGVYKVDAAKMPQFQPPKYSPQPIIGREELGVLGAAMAGLSLLGSALTRTGTIGAMNAFAAGLTGYHAGKAEAVKKNFQDFEVQFKSAIAEHNANVEKYKQILLNDRENVEVRLSELKAAIKADDGYAPSMDSFDAAWDYITKLDLAGKTVDDKIKQFYDELPGKLKLITAAHPPKTDSKKPTGKVAQNREAIAGGATSYGKKFLEVLTAAKKKNPGASEEVLVEVLTKPPYNYKVNE